MPETSSTSIMPTAAVPNLPVFGSGTPGRLTKWTGFTSSNSAIGDSSVFEDKFGKVGIGTDSPTSKLTVAGMIETTLGGLKLPDGTVQTTAGLASIFHDATLTGIGTGGSPLAVAVPLTLSGSSPINPILTVTNTGPGLVLRGVSSAFGKPGVLGTSTDPGGIGVSGETATNIGVFGTADSGIGVSAQSVTGTALKAFSASGGDAVVAEGGPSDGDLGGAGVVATGGDDSGRGQGGNGVVATGGDNSINGQGGTGVLVFGGTGSGPGNNGGVAIHAFGGSGVNPAIRGLAGIFVGDVDVTGNLSKASGSFKIDHPLDPENKYLYHSFVESPDMKNIYDGVIRLDANGEAIVSMPEWFSALNRDFRYLLTAIGAPMPGLYVAGELQDNSFRIAGGQPGMKVSWQVPAVQKVRETAARMEAQGNLRQLLTAASAFNNQNGRPPASLTDLAKFCAGHPDTCSLDAELTSGQKSGYFYFVSPSTAAAHFTLGAEPIYPGITGGDTLEIDQGGHLTIFSTPGAAQARQQMFDNIRAAGAEKITELLNMDRSALPRVGVFLASRETTTSAFDMLDRHINRDDGNGNGNGNGLVSVDEILNFRTGTDISLDGFLDSVNREMRLDLLSPEHKRAIGVGLSDLRGNPGELSSFDGLCSLTRLYINGQSAGDDQERENSNDGEGVASRLCARLKAAEAASRRGDSEAKNRFLRTYMSEVAAQTHRTLTQRNVTTLTTLAQTL